MKAIPVRTRIMEEGENLSEFVISSLEERNLKLEDGDIVAVASKIVALSQGRTVEYESKETSDEAGKLGEKYKMHPGFVEVILEEADRIFGGLEGAILTMKDGFLIANAGADLSNVEEGKAVLWPENPEAVADGLRKKLGRRFGVGVGVVLVDSWCMPLRRGTVGLSLGSAGFEPVKDDRGKKDLFGREMRITQENLADGLATAAKTLMGERDEKIPIVVIRDGRVEIKDGSEGVENRIDPEKCLFSSIYTEELKG